MTEEQLQLSIIRDSVRRKLFRKICNSEFGTKNIDYLKFFHKNDCCEIVIKFKSRFSEENTSKKVLEKIAKFFPCLVLKAETIDIDHQKEAMTLRVVITNSSWWSCGKCENEKKEICTAHNFLGWNGIKHNLNEEELENGRAFKRGRQCETTI